MFTLITIKHGKQTQAFEVDRKDIKINYKKANFLTSFKLKLFESSYDDLSTH